MRFKIYRLRYRGRRLPWRDVHNGGGHVAAESSDVLPRISSGPPA